MGTREKFERWVNIDLGLIPEKIKGRYKTFHIHLLWLAWQEQQKEIDVLNALNPDVSCPACDGVGIVTEIVTNTRSDDLKQDLELCYCNNCDGTGKTSTIKAQECRIKELEAKIKADKHD